MSTSRTLKIWPAIATGCSKPRSPHAKNHSFHHDVTGHADRPRRRQPGRERQAPGKDLVVFAGASLASAFIKQDLFDEYRVMIHPRLVGNGIPLFQGLSAEHELKLQRATTFPCGVVLLQYLRDPRTKQ